MICKEYVTQGETLMLRAKFTLPQSLWADKICLVGDHNSWNRTSCPMQRESSGHWSATLKLEIGHAYQFRYLVDNHQWLNDSQADAYVCNPHNCDNFVVIADPMFQRHSDELPASLAHEQQEQSTAALSK